MAGPGPRHRDPARLDRVLGNEEIRNIITAVGNSIGEEEDPTRRRYGKIVMMSDADVDGSHIRTLLMTFFLPADAPPGS